MSDLPRAVLEEMRGIMEEMQLFNFPPDGSFTLKDYYDAYVAECDARNVGDEFRLKLDGVRAKLDRLVDEGELETGKFNKDGSPTNFYWRAAK